MRKLFSTTYSRVAFNFATLVLRIGSGIFMIPHGYAKLLSFGERKDQFMSFLGLSGSVSLGLAIFAEFFCSILFIGSRPFHQISNHTFNHHCMGDYVCSSLGAFWQT
ncbi:DoxX family protein [Olivibacter sp. XZL3]|uniref:DoxX family protein n=1 Tax=Olivibacter sp. XZL3 TaxID=1735116 RepID=UPI001064FA6C|nr:DoxX family protein [Olivibacter sp. XZL3]